MTRPQKSMHRAARYLLINDFAGASLVALGAWQHWSTTGKTTAEVPPVLPPLQGQGESDEWETFASAVALGRQRCGTILAATKIAQTWRRFPIWPPPLARTADMWRDSDQIRIDAMFQGSDSPPFGHA